MAGIWYRQGTVALTQASKRVTGTGTLWLDQAVGPTVGNTFWCPDDKPYEVERVISDTELDLVEAYAGSTVSGAAYKIVTPEKFSVAALASQVAATLQYAQAQYANMSTWAASDLPVDVPVILPNGVDTKLIPNLVKMVEATDGKLTETENLAALDVPSTEFGRARLADADAVAQLTALGASAFGRARLADADAEAQRTALALGSAAQRTALGTGPLYSRDSIIGAVGQVSGVPTGAVIESNTSANGGYVKYADGTLICYKTYLGGLWTGQDAPIYKLWTFPAAPVGEYAVMANWIIGVGLNSYALTFQNKVATSATAIGYVGQGVSGYVDVILVGRWY